MLENLSVQITNYLISKELLDIEDSDVVVYRLQLMFEKIIGLIMVVLIGMIHETIIGLLLFLICFSFLRRYSGGYHCKSQITCLLVSLALIVIGNEIIVHLVTNIVSLEVLMISVVISFAIGSSNNPDMDWDKEEQLFSTRKARICLVVETVFAIVMFFLSVYYCPFIVTAIAINAICLTIGRFQEGGIKSEAERKDCKKTLQEVDC